MTIARDHGSGVLRPAEGRREASLFCLLTTVHPERGLSRVLLQHLTQELPRIAFTLRADVPELDAVWLCGFEPGAGALVARLRRLHPEARLLVSGRRPTAAWAEEALSSGADTVCGWPVSLDQVQALLRADPRR